MAETAEVCVIGGAGHVGLPLSLVFAAKGMRTLVYDTNPASFDELRQGRIAFAEEGGEELLVQALESGRLTFSSDPESVRGVRNLVLTIGTPVDEFLNPVYSVMTDCVDALLPYLSDDQLLVLRSTVPPGVTAWLERYLANEGRRPLLAFCPERVVQGRAIREIQELPQIVSGTTPEALQQATDLFAGIAASIVRMEPMEAEFAKLFCNAYRYLQFAVTNQFYMMASSAGLDYGRILKGMKQDYSRMDGIPGPGLAAGPCLFKDTLQLCAFYDNQFSLGADAMMVNEGLPLYLVRRLEARYELTEMTIGLLGMAFKADSDDTRSSLSYKLRKILHPRAKAVLAQDPHVRDDSLVSLDTVLGESDLLIVCVPHSAYEKLTCGDTPVLDLWEHLDPEANTIITV